MGKAPKIKGQRPAASYSSSAKALSQWAPSLKKYAHRKRLTRWEKAAISRKEKILRHTENLHPLTKQQARAAKRAGIPIVGKGIRAVRLRNTASGAKIRIKDGKLVVGSNGRAWNYVPVDPPNEENLAAAADDVMENEPYDEETEYIQVNLWTTSGRANAGYASAELFEEDISKALSKYKDNPENFILGIAWARIPIA
jgi:hypothetical protein